MPPKSAVASRLQYVSVRKATFTSGVRVGNMRLLKYWPHDSPSPEDMAEMGFYYTPTKVAGDQVTCFWCGKKEKHLGSVLSVASVHHAHNDKCPYAVIYHFLSMFKSDKDMASFWGKVLANEAMPASVAEPHSDASIQLRQTTFKNLWKFDSRKKSKVSAHGMASAGFFFAPAHPDDDRVICMYCGCPLSEWDIGDDPWEEHRTISRQYTRASHQPECHFLATLEPANGNPALALSLQDQSLDSESVENDPFVDLRPNLDAATSSDSSPLNKSVPSILDTILSPSQLPEPEAQPTTSASLPPNDLDQLDISIEQLSDPESHLDERVQSIRRYPRRKRQAKVFPKDENGKNGHNLPEKSPMSLVLEVLPEPEKNNSENDSDDAVQTHSDSDHEDLPSLAAESSAFHEPSSSSIPEHTVDEDYAESNAEGDSLAEVSPPKVEKGPVSPKRSKKTSRFDDGEFGINEKDIDHILNSPRKERKFKKIKTKQAPAASSIFHDISDQNLGDYDENNLSFLEKDIHVEAVDEKTPTKPGQKGQTDQNDHNNQSDPNKPESMNVSQDVPVSPSDQLKAEHSKDNVLDSSIMEIPKPEPKVEPKSEPKSEPKTKEAVSPVLTASPKKQKPLSPEQSIVEQDDDVIFDNLSPIKRAESPTNIGSSHSAEDKSSPRADVSDQVADQMDLGDDGGDHSLSSPTKSASEEEVLSEKDPKSDTSGVELDARKKVNDEDESGSKHESGFSKTDGKSGTESQKKVKLEKSVERHSVEESSAESNIVAMEVARTASEPRVGESKLLTKNDNDPPKKTKSSGATHLNQLPETKHMKEKVVPLETLSSSISISGKRSLDGSDIESLSKKRKAQKDETMGSGDNERSQSRGNESKVNGAAVHKAGPLESPEVRPPITASPNVSALEAPEESPVKDVIVSPSSYKEYMADVENMDEDFVDASNVECSVVAEKKRLSDVQALVQETETGSLEAKATEMNPAIPATDAPATDAPATDAPATVSSEKMELAAASFIENSAADTLAPWEGSPEVENYGSNSTSTSPGAISSKVLKRSSGKSSSPTSNTSPAELLKEHQVTRHGVSSKLEIQMTSEIPPAHTGNHHQEKPNPAISSKKNFPNPDANPSRQNLRSLERLSFLDIQASTPVKTQGPPPTPEPPTSAPSNPVPQKLPHLNTDTAVSELQGVDDAIDYITDVMTKGYELHNDVDGTLTDFIAAMPEEEEDMSVEEWIVHNASSCRRVVEDVGNRIIQRFEQDFDQLIDHVAGLETID